VPAENERRRRLLRLGAGAIVLAIAAVAVVIAVDSGGSGSDLNLRGKTEVKRLLKGIPQRGMVLGDFLAPVEVVEFADLQCPVCKGYSEDVLPPIIEGKVRQGKVKIAFRNFTTPGHESVAAGAAALAAGKQGRGWNYVELFYRNQGEEKSGYVTDDFLKAVAEDADVKNISRWEKERVKLTSEVEATSADAESLGFKATPSFVVGGQTTPLKLLSTPKSPVALEEAIEKAH